MSRNTRLKKNPVTKTGHKDISLFFSPPKQKDTVSVNIIPTSSATAPTKTVPQINNAKTPPSKQPSPSAPQSLSPSKTRVLGDLENIPPSSPELVILSSPELIPETPDSQIRPTRGRQRGTLQSSRDVSGLEKADKLSPVCRSAHRDEREDRRSGSVKRLFSSSTLHDDSSNAKKRSRTDNTQLTRTASGPKTNGLKITSSAVTSLEKTSPTKDHLLKECQQLIGQSEMPQSSTFSSSKANPPKCIDSRKQVISLKPVSVRGVSLQSSKGSSEQSVFTVIAEQKPTEKKASLPALTRHTSPPHTVVTAPESDTWTLAADKHTPAICTATMVPQTTRSGVKVQRPSVDGKGSPGALATSSSVNQDTAMISSDHNGVGGFDTLDDAWFDEPMEQSTAVVQVEKSKPARKVPDHVILCGGHNNRYWVLDVEEKPREKRLTITSSKALHPTETCLLKDGWETTPVSRGSVVHLEGRYDAASWLVDREQGFLVLFPDYLISGTSVANSIRCMRRAVLSEMFKSFDGGSKQMLNGTMVHEIFQKAALAKDFSTETLARLADEALHNSQHLGTMYSLGLSREEMKLELSDYLPSLQEWANEYLRSLNPKPITFKLPSIEAPTRGRDDSAVAVTVTELVDIEENCWSPRFGLKGKIDLTAQVRIQRPGRGGHAMGQHRTMALELKTGKETNSIEHRSQVILYTLMGMERNISAEAGFLLYLKTGNMHPVVASHMDRRELLKLRNMMAHHLGNIVEKGPERSRLSTLPDILEDRQTCKYCPQRRNCALYERVVNTGSPDNISSDSVRDFVLQETGHLTPLHLKYFSDWLLLCSLETVTMENKNVRKHVWLQTAEEREKSGGCVGNLELLGPVLVQSEEVFLHHFQRRATASQHGVNSGLAEGDRVVVSDQEGRLIAVASGYLCAVSGTSISCTLDKDLSKFSGVLFRLDHDEGVIGLTTHLTNLSRLMEDSQDSNRLRELIVDLRPPEFISALSSVLPRDAKDTVANILKGLNKPQKQAMKKVLLSKDYTLIVGMPGTGKTTTICTLVRILHACGFSVLLTSYTHSAVDNILLKLKRFRVGFLRLGRGQKVHPDILPYTEERGKKDAIRDLSELEQLYNKELVVATTCMGTKHPIFSRRRFDFCIIDEASQISQPICLGPLFYANRFVLVGDHQQLPPIVQNQEARSLGMDESLFKRLELHSEAVVQLNVQYRMNSQIMSLSNSLMYEGRLECGSERTAAALLTLPFLVPVQSQLGSLAKTHSQHDLAWIQSALLPSNAVCFLDTSQVPALETVEQGGVSNHVEAALIHTLLTLLIKAGCKSSDIGVIAPYRQQLKSISALLQSQEFSGVEVNTVDRYQGRDKSLIVLSFVRSTTEEGHLGELLKDWRRLNVAVTRAKHKLLMVGSALTLRRYAPLEKLLNHLQQENMITLLPPAAHEALPSIHL